MELDMELLNRILEKADRYLLGQIEQQERSKELIELSTQQLKASLRMTKTLEEEGGDGQ